MSCASCGGDLGPAQWLLDPGGRAGSYLFRCVTCGYLTWRDGEAPPTQQQQPQPQPQPKNDGEE